MALLAFCAVIVALVWGLAVALSPHRRRRPRPPAISAIHDVLALIGPVRLTVFLDVALVLALAGWYALATVGAPRHPSPSTGQVFAAPVAVGFIGDSHGLRRRYTLHATLFGTGYVDLLTAAIGWAVFINAALLLLWAFIGFARVLWSGPASHVYNDPGSGSYDTDVGG
jgi:hypothetical protein